MTVAVPFHPLGVTFLPAVSPGRSPFGTVTFEDEVLLDRQTQARAPAELRAGPPATEGNRRPSWQPLEVRYFVGPATKPISYSRSTA